MNHQENLQAAFIRSTRRQLFHKNFISTEDHMSLVATILTLSIIKVEARGYLKPHRHESIFNPRQIIQAQFNVDDVRPRLKTPQLRMPLIFHRGPLELSPLVISEDPSAIAARARPADGIARTSLRDFIVSLVSGVSQRASERDTRSVSGVAPRRRAACASHGTRINRVHMAARTRTMHSLVLPTSHMG